MLGRFRSLGWWTWFARFATQNDIRRQHTVEWFYPTNYRTQVSVLFNAIQFTTRFLRFHFHLHRTASMHFSPVPRCVPTKNSKGKSVTWNDKQLAVTRLLTETSALIDIFDEMAMRLGPNVELRHPTVPVIEPIVIPESNWSAMLTDSCNSLEEKLINFRPRKHKSLTEIIDV